MLHSSIGRFYPSKGKADTFYTNLIFRTTEEDLQEYFTTFGTLADVYIPKPPRGFAFVTFEKGDVAEAVLGVSSRENSQLNKMLLFSFSLDCLTNSDLSQQKHFLRDMQLNVTIPDPPAKKQKFAGGQDEGYGGQPPYHGYKQQQPQFPQYVSKVGPLTPRP